jgi:TRAP-type C4-dicarboxylate transport system substrate-binding protein
MLANGRAWRALPPDLQAIVTTAFNETALLQRKDVYDADQVLRP